MSTWINFKELRAKVKIADVLANYNVTVKVKGERASGFCPLPGHVSKSEGKRRSPSFSVHLTRGIFQCFSCGGKGNVIDLVCLMEGMNPDNPADIRKASLKLAESFNIQSENPPGQNGSHKPVEKSTSAPPVPAMRVVMNEPIDFELKHLDREHPYLSSRGFSPETIDRFGLGFCSRGLMAGRIAIPIHDPHSRLVGYAGRIVDDEKIDDEHPKYRFPGPRERDGVQHEFRKSMLLYNIHRLNRRVHDLIVVEGFASVWWLYQHGYANAVALMGSNCSPEQANLIAQQVENDGRIWFMPDGDDAGERLAIQALGLLAPSRFTRWIKLRESLQPTNILREEFVKLLKC